MNFSVLYGRKSKSMLEYKRQKIFEMRKEQRRKEVKHEEFGTAKNGE